MGGWVKFWGLFGGGSFLEGRFLEGRHGNVDLWSALPTRSRLGVA